MNYVTPSLAKVKFTFLSILEVVVPFIKSALLIRFFLGQFTLLLVLIVEHPAVFSLVAGGGGQHLNSL